MYAGRRIRVSCAVLDDRAVAHRGDFEPGSGQGSLSSSGRDAGGAAAEVWGLRAMSAKHRRRSSRRSSIPSLAVRVAVLVGLVTWVMSASTAGAGGITGIREATRARPTVQAAARVPTDADNIPGIPFGQSPVEGRASAIDDRYDVYAISLAGRQECVFSVRRTSGDGLFVLSLYGPGSTNIFESPQLPVDPDPLNTGGLSYTVPTAGSGIYYLVVRTLSGAGDYRICGPEADDNIPGVGLRSTRGGTVQDSLASSGDLADVFFVDLVAGRQTRFALSRSQGDIEASVSLFGPNQDDIWYVGTDPTKGPLAHVVAWAQPPQSFVYTPTTTGRYYVAVRQYSGSGWYRLAWGDPDDMIPGIPQATNVTPFELHDAVDPTSDPLDVFAVPLVAGDWYGFRAESELGAQAAPQLSLYSRWAVHVDGETALAQSGTGSVANFVSFAPTATGTYYLAVKGATGSGNYRLTTPASPFALNRDAYNFNNYGGSADEQLFREVFSLGTASLSPQASAYYTNVFRRRYGGGMCYGMAITAGMFYRNVWVRRSPRSSPPQLRCGTSGARRLAVARATLTSRSSATLPSTSSTSTTRRSSANATCLLVR